MLEQLSLNFKVIGDGLDSLKKIDAQINTLKNSMNNTKNSISSAFSSLKNKILLFQYQLLWDKKSND